MSNLYNLLYVPFFTIIVIIYINSEFSSSFFSNPKERENALIAIFVTSVFISFIQCLVLYLFFNGYSGGYQFISTILNDWANRFSLLALDGISIGFVILTPFTIFLSAGITHNLVTSFKERVFYYLSFLFIELFLFLAFTTTNIIVFYFAFEAVLLPIFLMIGRWGSNASKKQAANYMFVYTVFGSVLMLFAILSMLRYYGTANFTALKTILSTETSSAQISFWWWCFFIGFAVKVPVCPFHLWLPEAHVEAPAAGSVILAALLLKLGGYGFLRVLIDILNYQTKLFQITATAFGLMSVIWGCGVILTLTDIKRVIAFSSIIHMNLTVMGLFVPNFQGIHGSITVMLAHALCSSGLFMCIGMLYTRYHSRMLPTFGGLSVVMPNFVFVFGVYSLANMALPGTFNFVGEIILLQGIFLNDPVNALLCGYSVVFSAVYSLELFSRICFGTLTSYFTNFFDIDDKPYFRSWYTEYKWQLPILVPIIFFGIYPVELLSLIESSVYSRIALFAIS